MWLANPPTFSLPLPPLAPAASAHSLARANGTEHTLEAAEEGIHLGYIARSYSKPCTDTGLSGNLELCTSLADTPAPEKSSRAALTFSPIGKRLVSMNWT